VLRQHFFHLRLLFSSGILLAFGQSVFAQEPMSLRQVIDIALQNNYAVKIAKNQLRTAENDATWGNAGLLPVVNATAQTNNNYNVLFRQQRQVFQTVINPVTGDTTSNEVTQINDFSNRTNIGLGGGVNLNWTILGAAVSANYRRLEEIREAGRENTEVAIENTVAAVTNAYYNISQQEQLRVVLENALKIAQEQLRLAKNRYDVGSGSRQEFLSAQVNYNTSQSALLTQEQQVVAARIALNQLLVRPATGNIAPTDSLTVNPNLRLEELRDAVRQQNPALLLAQRNRSVASLNARLVQAQRYPLVNVFAGLTRNYQNSRAFIVPNVTNSAVLNYGATVSVPIFNGMNLNRQVQNARIAQETAEFQYQDLLNQTLAGLETTFANYTNSLKLIELERQNLQVAEQNVTIALERYKIGVTTLLEVQDVQRNAVAASSRLISAVFNAKLAETELLRLSSQIVQ
jgi:outer membrane protein TolC